MLKAVRIWILLSALLVGAGWVLSGLHQLNRLGYASTFALGFCAWLYSWRKAGRPPQKNPGRPWHKLRRRFQRPAPQLFLLLLGLACICGLAYAPGFADASMYRTPRVWHWLAAGQWHWIHTFDIRMNIANCGFEWLTAPLMLFTGSDRWLFFINLVSYALLPGLIFSVFRQLEVTGRVAWWWMWILSGGFCYAFQAGTIANDSFAAIYALASVDFALRAGKTGQIGDLWISMLAAALTTGAKQTDIPLVLPWLIAALPALHLLWHRPWATMTIAAISLLISAMPMICLNLGHDGNWSGVPNHPGPDWTEWQSIELRSPFWGIVGNAFSLPLQQYSPPFFFCYQSWNDLMARFVNTPLGSHFSAFENFGHLKAFPTEISAGLGFMIGLLLPVSIFWHCRWNRQRGCSASKPVIHWNIFLLRVTPWALLLLFMAKVSAMESARQLAPYYPFLLPAVLVLIGMPVLVRKRWWQRFGLLSMATTAALMILSPSRPLWPAGTFFGLLAHYHSHSNLIARAQSYYQAPEINDAMRHVFQKTLPADEPVVGYATTVMALEPGLWRPFQRRVERVRPDDPREYLEHLGIHYVVVENPFLRAAGISIEELMRHYDARLIDKIALSSGWNKPPSYIYLIRLNSNPGDSRPVSG